MSNDIMKGRWHDLKGSAKEMWGELTDDDLEEINGEREALVGKLQERYGHQKSEAERKVEEWLKYQPSLD